MVKGHISLCVFVSEKPNQGAGACYHVSYERKNELGYKDTCILYHG
jgi:hypothetical protein